MVGLKLTWPSVTVQANISLLPLAFGGSIVTASTAVSDTRINLRSPVIGVCNADSMFIPFVDLSPVDWRL